MSVRHAIRPTFGFVLGGLVASACGGADRSRPAVDGGAGSVAATDGAPVGPDVTATIDVTIRHQTMVGFGAAIAYYANLLSGRVVAGDDIYQMLFNDLGLDILRIGNWYQNQIETGASATTPFSDSAIVAVVQNATAALGHPPKIIMSSWSPPSYLKSTGDTKNGGTLIRQGGAFAYAQFAQWWVSALAAYATNGVTPDYISIQNEPDFTATWETCRFDAAEGTNAGYGRALDAVSTAMKSAGLASQPQFIAPEISGVGRNRVQNYLAQVSLGEIGVIAHHLYNGGDGGADPAPDSFNTAMIGLSATAATDGKPLFMTEFSPMAPSMLNTAWMIHDAVAVEGLSAYIYWELIWPKPAAGSAPTALVTLEEPTANFTTPKGYTINDVYYALRHYARWVDPGWVRVDASSTAPAVKISAFQSPDAASLTIVLVNTDAAEHVVALAIAPGTFAFTTAMAFRTSGTSERTTPVDIGAGNVVTLPGQSIATVTLTP
jgi:glucuronoarabinoxylan endo-1,4-beta-xylanase